MQDADLDRSVLEVGEIARDRARQPFGTADQILRRAEHGAAAFRDLGDHRGDRRQHAGQRAGDGFGAGADVVDVDRLVIEDAGELAVGLAHGGDARRHRRDHRHRLVDRMLDVVDQRADLAGRLRGLLRQRLHLARDHGEAASGGAGACGFDRGIERKQRGLGGDAFDQLHDGADAAGGVGEAANGVVGAAELVDGLIGRDLGGGDFAAGACDQRQQRTRGVRHRADVARRDVGGVGGVRGARVHVLVAAAEVGGGDLDLLAGLVEGPDQLDDRRAEALGEERAAGMMELGLGLAAALVDRERVGVDQRLAHPFGGRRDVGHGAAADALRQRGVAVTGSDERDRVDHRVQPPLDPPGGGERGEGRRRPGRRSRFGEDEGGGGSGRRPRSTGSRIHPPATSLRRSIFIGKSISTNPAGPL